MPSLESLISWDENLASAGGKYSVCCVNADGYCLDLFESEANPCGENNEWVSDEFCYAGNVPKCEPGDCFINGVRQRVDMSYFECEEFAKDAGTSSWSWSHS